MSEATENSDPLSANPDSAETPALVRLFAPEAVTALARMLSKTQEIELSCSEVYELLDEYAEASAQGDVDSRLMPLVQHHISVCPDCREELEALLRVLQAD